MPPAEHSADDRAAAIGGAAVAAKKHRDAKQAETGQQQPGAPAAAPAPAPAAAPAAGLGEDSMAKLKQLGELHEQGVLTDDEFAAEKAKLLGG